MVDLWGYDISRLVWFYAAGKSFFPGMGLLIIAAALSASLRAIWVNLIRYALIVLGVLQILLSATPISVWIYAIWAASLLALLYVIFKPPHNVKSANLTRIAFIFICAIALLVELPFHFSPKIPEKNFGKLYVIGDSVSAGTGGKSERPWPIILGDKYRVNVTNLSVSGATVGSALTQADQVNDDDAIVLLEIGGNDLLAQTSQPIFEQNLRSLLQKVARPNRSVLMFELPLAPWHIGYGRIQRRLAAEFGVTLVPKSFLADVFGTKVATVDLAHLSSEGHKIMAEKIWSLLGKCFGVKPSQ